MKSNTQMILDVCTNESCIDVGRKFLTPLSLSREWHFPVLSTAATTCKRFTNPGTGSLVCSGCYTSGKKISGYYFRTYQYAALHLSRTDDTLQIAANVTTMTSTSVLTVDISKGSGCRNKSEHVLRYAFFWDLEARYEIQRGKITNAISP